MARTPSPKKNLSQRGKVEPLPPTKAAPNECSFFTNHSHVLITLSINPSASLREIAGTVGITERGVQKIIADLADAEFLIRTKVGRRNEYRLNLLQPLRHPVEKHRTVADIVRVLYPDALVGQSKKR